MTTQRDEKNRTVLFECDECGDTVEDDDVRSEGDFVFAWMEHKRAGWTAKQVGAGWRHACPRCARTSTMAKHFER